MINENMFLHLLEKSEDRQNAVDKIYYALRDTPGRLSKVTVHKYLCRRGCPIATVFVLGGETFCAVRDYKYSPGMNAAKSVESARLKNTIDKDRHRPSHVYDLAQFAVEHGGVTTWLDGAGVTMDCRHSSATVLVGDIMRTIEGVKPGHPRKPTRL